MKRDTQNELAEGVSSNPRERIPRRATGRTRLPSAGVASRESSSQMVTRVVSVAADHACW
jgi:hypothetical protein